MLHVPLCHWTIQLLDFVYTENQHNIFRFHCFRIVSKVGLIIQFCIALVFNAKSLNYFVAFVKFSVQHCLASTMPQCTCCTPNISCAIKYFVLYVFIHRFCASYFIQKLVFPWNMENALELFQQFKHVAIRLNVLETLINRTKMQLWVDCHKLNQTNH